jgi:hypothetical protein
MTPQANPRNSVGADIIMKPPKQMSAIAPRDDRVVSIDVHRLATRVNSEQLQTHEISNDVM